MSLSTLMTKVFTAELTEGEHKANIVSWELKPNADPTKEYIRMTFNVENAGKTQEFTRNMFERDVSIAVSHIRRQLDRSNESLIPTDFFNEIIADKIGLIMWVQYPVVSTKNGAQRRQNVYFQPPLSNVEAASSADMELPVGVGV